MDTSLAGDGERGDNDNKDAIGGICGKRDGNGNAIGAACGDIGNGMEVSSEGQTSGARACSSSLSSVVGGLPVDPRKTKPFYQTTRLGKDYCRAPEVQENFSVGVATYVLFTFLSLSLSLSLSNVLAFHPSLSFFFRHHLSPIAINDQPPLWSLSYDPTAVDIWSIGSILFVMLTLEVPYRLADPSDSQVRHVLRITEIDLCKKREKKTATRKDSRAECLNAKGDRGDTPGGIRRRRGLL